MSLEFRLNSGSTEEQVIGNCRSCRLPAAPWFLRPGCLHSGGELRVRSFLGSVIRFFPSFSTFRAVGSGNHLPLLSENHGWDKNRNGHYLVIVATTFPPLSVGPLYWSQDLFLVKSGHGCRSISQSNGQMHLIPKAIRVPLDWKSFAIPGWGLVNNLWRKHSHWVKPFFSFHYISAKYSKRK